MPKTTQLVRQWLLLRGLSARPEGATVGDLAAENGVCEKTIRRDLLALARIGFPLQEQTGPHGLKHWQLAAADGVPPVHFGFVETASLYLGRQLLQPLAGTSFGEGAQKAFARIRTMLGKPVVKYLEKIAAALHATSFGQTDYASKAEIIDQLMSAIADRTITSISYQSQRSTEPVSYPVYPLGLVHHKNSLYLIAWSQAHKEVRHFKVDRIDEIASERLKFATPENFDLQEHLAHTFGIYRGNGRPLRARIQFTPAAGRYVQEKQWHPSQTVTRQRDGSVVAEFELSSFVELKSWVLSFGSEAVVLSPREFREEVRKTVEAMRAGYQAGKGARK